VGDPERNNLLEMTSYQYFGDPDRVDPTGIKAARDTRFDAAKHTLLNSCARPPP
jgi:hypothetical protein